MTEKHLTEQRFSQLELASPLLQAIAEAGFEYCTPIQAKALPIALQGENVIGQARTGTGKTATFLIAVIQHLLNHPPGQRHRPGQPRALILAPTRELAVQIFRDADALVKHTELRLGLAYGGTDYDKQRRQLEQGVDILIGTPGRIIDYFKQRVFHLKSIQAMVLDEADRMFDLGFIKDIRYLLRRMPPPEQRLNLLFSATLSYRVIELAYEHMDNPQVIKTEEDQVTTDKIQQSIYYVANDEKIPLLIGLYHKLQPERAIVFVNTKAEVERVTNYLKGNDIQAEALSGDVPQRKRQRLVLDFQKGEFPVLVATDVAARGLHIPDVSHVINYDLPQDPEDYVHRIGRTGRIGAEGCAISLACESYAFYLPDIEDYIGKKIPQQLADADLLIEPKPPAKPQRRARPSQRQGRRRQEHKTNGKPRRRRRRKPSGGKREASRDTGQS